MQRYATSAVGCERSRFFRQKDDRFTETILNLTSGLDLTAVHADRGHQYLHLKLKDNALILYQQQNPASRDDFNGAIIDMRAHFENVNRNEIRKITFSARNFIEITETPEGFLTAL